MAIRGGLMAAAERARVLGAHALQVFVDDPRAWAPRATPHPDTERFRELLAERGTRLLVHASYLVNLASPDAEVHVRSIERMTHELAAASRLGADAVTAHVGSHRGAGVTAGISRVAEAIARIVEAAGRAAQAETGPPRLVLEVSAGQGDALGVTVEEMGEIVDAASRRGVPRDRLGICLDTAHLWGAGYALDDPAAIDALLSAIDATVGPGSLALVHLNDSRVARGARQDRHEHIGAGRIGERGLGHLVRHPRLGRLPVILETPDLDAGWDALDMARVRALANAVPGPATVPASGTVVRVGEEGGARAHIPGSTPDDA
jgi:deoxyribonuclease-4